MEEGLYNSSVVCPVCEKAFVTTRVKANAIKIARSDEDFCIHYEGLNPMLYDVWVCKYCGFTEFSTYFHKVKEIDLIALKKFCLNKFTEDLSKEPFDLSDFHEQVYAYFDLVGKDGERSNQAAIETFKLLLKIQEVRETPFSNRAKAALRIGWVYRMMEDAQEFQYLGMAADYFTQAFETEAFAGGGMDSETCAYMIGELNRRSKNIGKAIEWYGKSLRIAQESKNQKISNIVREQIQVVKQAAEKAKQSQ